MSKYRINVEGKTYEMDVELVDENAVQQSQEKKEYKKFNNVVKDSAVRITNPSVEKMTTNNKGVVTAPIPGTVLKVLKIEGETAKAGEIILILEAMKMENEILAPVDGIIAKINYTAGGTVASGDVLFEIQ